MALTLHDDGVISVEDDDPVAIAARLRHLEDQIAGMPADAIDAMGADIGQVTSWLSAVLAKLTARATRLQQQGEHTDAKRTAATTGLGDRDAAKAVRRGEERLVAEAVAERLSVREFERRCRELVDRLSGDDGIAELEQQRRKSRAHAWEDPISGMTLVHGEWDPIRGEAIRRALDAEIAARIAAGSTASTPSQRAHLAAEALHALICGQRTSTTESAAVMVLIDLDAIINGTATRPNGTRRTSETHRGTPLPVETIRRIACDAGIIPIVLDGAGQALDVGRERRLATRAQRAALRVMYPTCAMDPDSGSSRRVGHPHHEKGLVLPERAVWRTSSTDPFP